MRKNVIALSATLGGFLAAWLGTNYLLNYREMRVGEWYSSSAIIALALYLLGIYTTALVFQQISRQESEIEPSFLVLGCIIAWLVVSLPMFLFLPLIHTLYPFDSSFLILVILILLPFLGIRSACRFERSKSNANLRVLLFRALIPSTLILTLVIVHNNSFPGLMAPAKIREQWAYKEFGDYNQVVRSIKTCQPIIKQVGNVIFVAPTQGRNYVISDPGSSGHSGELTLEIVGDRGVGVANFAFHIFTAVSPGKFTYQDKTEKLVCKN